MATVVLHGDDEIERVELFHSAAEVGQGAHTALVQMAAEAVGVSADLVVPTYSDTAKTGDSGSASASRLTRAPSRRISSVKKPTALSSVAPRSQFAQTNSASGSG